MCKIKDIIELETFRMAHKEQEYLIVVEGKKAVQLVDRFKHIIEPAQKKPIKYGLHKRIDRRLPYRSSILFPLFMYQLAELRWSLWYMPPDASSSL